MAVCNLSHVLEILEYFFIAYGLGQERKNIIKVYEGETSRSLRLRSTEHIRDFKNKNPKSVLYKHKIMDHIDEEVEFNVEITGIFKDALSRQANESVRIYSRKSSEILNSKSEFNHSPTARVMVEKKRNIDYKANQAKMSPQE